MKFARWVVAVVALGGAAACIDLGQDIPEFDAEPPPVDDGGGEGGAAGGGDAAECVSGPIADPAAADHQLEYVGLNVSNASLTIAAGESVAWTNADGVPHTVTSGAPDDADAGSLFDGPTPPGGAWGYRFCEPGDYVYYCKPHQASMLDYHVIVQ